MTTPPSDIRLTGIRERARRMIADKVTYARLQYAEDYGFLLAEVDGLRALVADFVDPDPCSLDHNGYCQAHGWYSGRPCPHRRAKDLGLEEPLS